MDKELAAGKRRGPLHGVPMAHKDMYYRKGELSTGGSAILDYSIGQSPGTPTTVAAAATSIIA